MHLVDVMSSIGWGNRVAQYYFRHTINVFNNSIHNPKKITQFVGDESISLHLIAELVCLASNEHRHVMCTCHQRRLRRARAADHAAVRQQGPRAKQDQLYLWCEM